MLEPLRFTENLNVEASDTIVESCYLVFTPKANTRYLVLGSCAVVHDGFSASSGRVGIYDVNSGFINTDVSERPHDVNNKAGYAMSYVYEEGGSPVENQFSLFFGSV